MGPFVPGPSCLGSSTPISILLRPDVVRTAGCLTRWSTASVTARCTSTCGPRISGRSTDGIPCRLHLPIISCHRQILICRSCGAACMNSRIQQGFSSVQGGGRVGNTSIRTAPAVSIYMQTLRLLGTRAAPCCCRVWLAPGRSTDSTSSRTVCHDGGGSVGAAHRATLHGVDRRTERRQWHCAADGRGISGSGC